MRFEEVSIEAVRAVIERCFELRVNMFFAVENDWDVVEQLANEGGYYCSDADALVQFLTDPEAGRNGFDPEAAAAFRADPDGFMADRYQVSREIMIAFREFVESDFRCTGRTKAGQKCRSAVLKRVLRPARFLPGISDRCPHHREPAREALVHGCDMTPPPAPGGADPE